MFYSKPSELKAKDAAVQTVDVLDIDAHNTFKSLCYTTLEDVYFASIFPLVFVPVCFDIVLLILYRNGSILIRCDAYYLFVLLVPTFLFYPAYKCCIKVFTSCCIIRIRWAGGSIKRIMKCKLLNLSHAIIVKLVTMTMYHQQYQWNGLLMNYPTPRTHLSRTRINYMWHWGSGIKASPMT